MSRPLRLLLFSTLYPSSARPGHGLFVETRLRELLRRSRVQARVLAPVPWFPSTHPRFGKWASWAATPRAEVRDGVEVLHPRYTLPPWIGMSLAPFLLAAASIGPLRRLVAQGFDPDVIDAHYYYPDGVAAVLLARCLGKPVTVTARGSDLNLIARYALPARMMRWAARHADASIGVSPALVDILRRWNVPPERLHMLRNGVDLVRFQPLPKEQMRGQLKLQGAPLLISVGNLVEPKGHRLVIDALAILTRTRPGARLAIVGEGPDRAALERHAASLGVAQCVTFAGRVDNEALARWYSASDALILASSREGWPNVLLEAMACGTPAVATAVGGVPHVVSTAAAGELIHERSAEGIVAAFDRLQARGVDREATRRHAERFGWDDTSQRQLALFTGLAKRSTLSDKQET